MYFVHELPRKQEGEEACEAYFHLNENLLRRSSVSIAAIVALNLPFSRFQLLERRD